MLEQPSLSKCLSCPMAPHSLFGPGLRMLRVSLGAAALLLPTSKRTAGWWHSSPHPHARTCLPPSPPWWLQGPWQEQGAPPSHHSRSGTMAHAPGSALDCNTAVTDFSITSCLGVPSPPFLAFPCQSHHLTSPHPCAVLLPGTWRENGNTRISACLEAGTRMQDSLIQTPN